MESMKKKSREDKGESDPVLEYRWFKKAEQDDDGYTKITKDYTLDELKAILHKKKFILSGGDDDAYTPAEKKSGSSFQELLMWPYKKVMWWRPFGCFATLTDEEVKKL